MSYRCDICGVKVPPGRPRLVHPVPRPRRPGEVERELACCAGCHAMLDQLPLSSVKDPYYLRPKVGARVTVLVEHEPAAPPSPPEAAAFGRPASKSTL